VDEIRFIDLFSGIGGFRRGLELSGGYRCVWSCDIDRAANLTYHRRFTPERGTHYSGDIRRVPTKQIPNHDLLTGGFPCQTFSDAGKRRGFKDPRGTLFYEIARIAKAKKPTLLLLENVPGLLYHDEGKTFATILHEMDELGYDAEWWVLNSGYFVPQQRRRVYIIGHFREKPTPWIFPIMEFGKGSIEMDGKIPHSSTLTASYSREGYGAGRPYIIFEGDGPGGKPPMRAFTPIECERLQGFPDNWTQGRGISLDNRYKAIGNAVTVNVVKFLGDRLKESINSKSKRTNNP